MTYSPLSVWKRESSLNPVTRFDPSHGLCPLIEDLSKLRHSKLAGPSDRVSFVTQPACLTRQFAACIMRVLHRGTRHSLTPSLSLEQCNRVKSVVFYTRRQERDGDGPGDESREIGLRHGSSAPPTPGSSASLATSRVTVIYAPSNLISFYAENRADLSSRTRSELFPTGVSSGLS